MDDRFYLPVYNRYPVVLERGVGSRVWDVDGNEYIDALSGIAVNSIGHCHREVVEAIQQQAEKLIHISNFYLNEPQAKLSQKLSEISGMDRIFLCNSGAESVEGAIKISRKYAHSIGRGGDIISFSGSFHGRTLATIATGGLKMQQGFEPIPLGFKHAEFNNMDSILRTVDDETAAIIIEPVQGEGGINIADPTFIKNLSVLCQKEEIVLIFDEVQCGIGRTGKMFAMEHYGIQPDIIALAKALGGGFPIGAVLSNKKVSEALKPGDHGTTFGGNPLACRAALAVIEVIEKENLLKEVNEKGEWLRARIDEFRGKSVKDVRIIGLMVGIEFDFETRPLVMEMMKRGVLANSTAGKVLRLLPPLNIRMEDLETIVEVLRKSLKTIRANG